MSKKRDISYIDLRKKLIELMQEFENINVAQNRQGYSNLLVELDSTLCDATSGKNQGVRQAARDFQEAIVYGYQLHGLMKIDVLWGNFEYLMKHVRVAAIQERKRKNDELYNSLEALLGIVTLIKREDGSKPDGRHQFRQECALMAYKFGWYKKNDDDNPTAREHLIFLAHQIGNCKIDEDAEDLAAWLKTIPERYQCIKGVMRFVNSIK